MKETLEVRLRYIAWDYDGACYSYDSPPSVSEDCWDYTGRYEPGRNEYMHELGLSGGLNGSLALERCYDTESEEDMKILQAMMEL